MLVESNSLVLSNQRDHKTAAMENLRGLNYHWTNSNFTNSFLNHLATDWYHEVDSSRSGSVFWFLVFQSTPTRWYLAGCLQQPLLSLYKKYKIWKQVLIFKIN